MLRVAVPNKGSLAEPASIMLTEAGYRQRSDRRELIFVDKDNAVEFFFLRPRDIAVYVGSGDLDAGITGRDLLTDSGTPAEEILGLGFATSRFWFAAHPSAPSPRSNETRVSIAIAVETRVSRPQGEAAPQGETWAQQLAGKRIATAYPGLVADYLSKQQVTAEVIRLDGAVETAIKLGVADVVADVVDTGSTLRQQGLELIGEPILTSEAILIRRPGANGGRVEQLMRRLQGVVMARQYVMITYDVRAEQLEHACAITPGVEAPTISPLHREGWVAVQAMVRRQDSNHIMDRLYDAGARAILVTDIRSCRL